jgi:hypothetical protein
MNGKGFKEKSGKTFRGAQKNLTDGRPGAMMKTHFYIPNAFEQKE